MNKETFKQQIDLIKSLSPEELENYKFVEEKTEFSQEQIFDELLFFANEIERNHYNFFYCNHFFEEFPNVDFELLQKQAIDAGFFIKKACDIKSKKSFFKELWNNHKSIVIFCCDENKL